MTNPARPSLAAVAKFADTIARDRHGADTGWQADAACAGIHSTDPKNDPFFPHATTSSNEAEYVFAKMICAGCPVRNECAEFAIATHQTDGLWGGLSPRQRRRARGERRRIEGDGIAS